MKIKEGIVEKLTRPNAVEIFWVTEKQTVEEIDSPCPGLDVTIAQKISVYEFFRSESEAQKYITELQADYMDRRLLTLHNNTLTGTVQHRYAHEYNITHSIEGKIAKVSELPDNTEELIYTPQRRVLFDEQFPVRPSFDDDSEPPYDFTLF